jgi:hypothetical protein
MSCIHAYHSLGSLDILQNLVKDKPLGFDQIHLPNSNWMKKVIYALCPSHAIFNEPREEVLYREIPKGEGFLFSTLFYVYC